MALEEKASTPDSTNGFLSFLSKKGFSLFVKVVDKCAPDRLLLFALNVLDNHALGRLMISFTIYVIEKLVPRKLRSIIITVADKYVPDTVANSRKVCVTLAAIGKYAPDKIIPPESVERWENLRTKFHIPKLISRRAKSEPVESI
jgi:hypothetical protein